MTIECLYLEDDDNDFEKWSQSLKLALEELDISIKRARKPNEAITLIGEKSSHFQLFVADLLITDGDEEKATGLLAVEVASKKPSLAILGLSRGEGSHPGIRNDFLKTAPRGKYVDKRLEPPKYTLATLKNDIKELLSLHGHWPGPKADLKRPKLSPGGLLELEAEIESVGERTLLGLLKQIQGDCSTFEPHYVSPGYSGSVVFRIVAYHDVTGVRQNLLVKLSREIGQLERELSRAPETAEASAGIYVPYLTGPPRHEGVWTAIAARFEEDAITMRDWLLSEKPSIKAVEELLTQLFVYGLKPAYSAKELLPDRSAIAEIFPQITSLARIRRAVKGLGPIIDQTKEHWNEELILRFVVEGGRINDHSAKVFPKGTARCLSHGDLHSRNILVARPKARNPRVFVIDPARRQSLHWATDPARLAADLWVSCLDGNDGKCVFWKNLALWRKSLVKWANNESVDSTLIRRNKLTWSALRWLRDKSQHAFTDLPPDLRQKWQFYLALVLEFLHLSIYDNVPPPKRVFCLLAAGDLLAKLERWIPWAEL